MISMEKMIKQKIEGAIYPEYLQVINNSGKHKGHSGDDGSGESHFLVRIKSDKFNGMSRVASHRMLNAILKDELKSLHSLSFSFVS